MRVTLNLMGLNVLDLCVETTATECATEYAGDDPGDCTTYPVGFTAPEPAPFEMDCPDRG